MLITVNTKGRFNYQTITVSQSMFDAIEAQGYIKTKEGIHEQTHSIEVADHRTYRQVLKLHRRGL